MLPSLTSPKFIRHDAKLTPSADSLDCKLPAPRRWLALVRNNGPFWQTPVYGNPWAEVPAETQFLLWETKPGRYQVAIPLIDGDWRITLRGVAGGLHFDADGGGASSPETPLRVAFTAQGTDPFALIHESMRRIATELKSFRLREDKPVPAFLDYLGWCTWDAFYHEVNEQKVVAGLTSLERVGIYPAFLILDDGWLDTEGDFLNDFASHPKKFPRGLAATITKVKARFGLRYFGIWHAFQGYWAGINPKGPLAARFKLNSTQGMIRWWEKKEVELNWVNPQEVACFYHEFYRWLKEQGVDLVKVDGQSALEKFSGEKMERVSTMAAYQQALQSAALTHFAASPIHCMCNGNDVALNLTVSNVWRNSDDFYPKQPTEKQQWHVHMNALNNIWTSTFAVPDWDMFQTHGPAAEFHAAARALSGGPIYICDKPGQKHRAELVSQLTLSGGKVVRFSQPALPTRDVLFTDFRLEKRLLKITNHNGANAEMGLFHCTPVAESVTDSFSPADVPSLSKGRYAAWLHQAKAVVILEHAKKHIVRLDQCTFEIASLSPLRHDWACFGLIDKIASSATILNWNAGPRWCSAELIDGGEAAFLCPARPKRILVNDRPHKKFRYETKTGLLRIQIPSGQTAKVTVELLQSSLSSSKDQTRHRCALTHDRL